MERRDNKIVESRSFRRQSAVDRVRTVIFKIDRCDVVDRE